MAPYLSVFLAQSLRCFQTVDYRLHYKMSFTIWTLENILLSSLLYTNLWLYFSMLRNLLVTFVTFNILWGQIQLPSSFKRYISLVHKFVCRTFENKFITRKSPIHVMSTNICVKFKLRQNHIYNTLLTL